MAEQSEKRVAKALKHVKQAWKGCCADYECLRLNSEAALQAAFYYHFRQVSKDAFKVYAGVKVKLPAYQEGQTDRVFADVLICSDDEVVVVVELKYKPLSRPKDAAVQKDLQTLAELRGRVMDNRRFAVTIERHDFGNQSHLVTPNTRAVLAAFMKRPKGDGFDVSKFWKDSRPEEGRKWSRWSRKLPPRLGMCIAFVQDNTATDEYFGRPFGGPRCRAEQAGD